VIPLVFEAVPFQDDIAGYNFGAYCLLLFLYLFLDEVKHSEKEPKLLCQFIAEAGKFQIGLVDYLWVSIKKHPI
jgi:hypothetical protein